MKTTDLPWDIICIIVSKLPVKSLLRFQIVSKRWYNLIQEPKFRKSHTNNILLQPNNSLILSRNYYHLTEEYYLLEKQNQVWKKSSQITLHPRFQGSARKFKIVSTCNGLLCLSDTKDFMSDNTVSIIIYNPITRQGAMLPKLILNRLMPKGFNFGYDNKTSKYKVVVQFIYPVIHIITVGENSWRELNYSRVIKSPVYYSPQTTSSTTDFYWFYSCDRKILVMDISDEKFRVIEMEEVPGQKFIRYFFGYEKYLTLFVTTSVGEQYFGRRIQIWELVDGSWKRQKMHDKVFRQEVDAISFAGGDRLLLKLKTLCDASSLRSPSEFVFAIYSPKNGEVTGLLSPDDARTYDLFSFVPTLESP